MKPQYKLFVALLLILLNVSMAVAEDNSDYSGFSGYLAMVKTCLHYPVKISPSV